MDNTNEYYIKIIMFAYSKFLTPKPEITSINKMYYKKYNAIDIIVVEWKCHNIRKYLGVPIDKNQYHPDIKKLKKEFILLNDYLSTYRSQNE